MLRLVNVVAQLKVRGARLDRLLEGRCPRLGRARGVGVKYEVGGCTVAVRRGGHATVTGPSREAVEAAVKELLSLVKEATPEAKAEWRVVNLIYESDLGREVMLDTLKRGAEALKLKVTYKLERFPGLEVQLPCGVTANVFGSGRVILLGCRDEEHARRALEELVGIVECYG